MVFVDLALPHDVDPAVVDLPGVTRLDLVDLADELEASDAGREVAEVRRIVTEEVSRVPRPPAARPASPRPWSRCARWRPSVVDAEMAAARPAGCPTSTPATRAEVLQAVRRVADKLLHEPTVRVKELANEDRARSPTPPRWPSCSPSTPRPSTP